MAFIQIQGGFPQERAEYMAAQIAAVMANIHRKENAPIFMPDNFIPVLKADEEQEEQQTEEPIDLNETSRALEKMLGRKQEPQ